MEEKTYVDILDNIPSSVFMITPEFRVVYYNQPFKRIFYPKEDNMLVGNTINCSLLLENQDCGGGRFCNKCVLNKMLRNAVVKGRPVYREVLEKSIYCDGEEKTFRMRLTIQSMYGGKRFVCMMDDIAEKDKFDIEADKAIKRDLNRAKKIQSKLLPADDAVEPLAQFSYIYRQSYQVGGDFFGLFKLSDTKFGGYIADVSGAGLASGMFTMFLHTNYQPLPSPAQSLKKLLEKFCTYNFPDESYITLFNFVADTAAHTLTVCNGGHNMPALLIKQGRVSAIGLNGKTVSGWYSGPEGYTDTVLEYSPGDKLILMTDGIADMKNDRGEELTYERLLHFANIYGPLSVAEFIKASAKEIKRFMGGKDCMGNDDCTLLAIQL